MSSVERLDAGEVGASSAGSSPRRLHPALQLLTVEVQPADGSGVVLVQVGGVANVDLLMGAARQLEPIVRSGDAVIDVSEVIVVEPRVLELLVEPLLEVSGGHGRFCLVSRRRSARLLLRRWGVADRIAVFATVRDALQARVHRCGGYGTGWERHPGDSQPTAL